MRRRALLLVSLAAALWAAPAWSAPQTGFVKMDDGVELAYDLYAPAGTAPAGGWPAVVVMHGLGQSKDAMAPIAQFFAAHGYEALAYTVRGQGTSTGDFDLVAPRDVADMQAMVRWLESQPGVSSKVGCFGISLGGGECWDATPTGIFDAAVPVATWTDLYTALWPGDVARSGVVAGFAQTVSARSSLIRAEGTAAIQSSDPAAIRALAAPRSAAPELGTIHTPVYLFQGRVDYAFDIDQARLALERLAGPKRLYVGDFGHPPSSFASPDFPSYVLGQSLAWFDRFLEGTPNGIDRGAEVTVADRTGRRRASFAAWPRTKVVGVGFRGTTAVRTGPRLGQALETFGGSTLRVQVQQLAAYPRLVAVVLANGRVVTHGAVVPHRGLDTIRLADYAVYLPKGTRLTLRLGPDGGSSDLAYLGFGATGTIRLGAAFLNLQTLAKPISR
ncbi:MAG TPA: alpha/beta fold hydrolase [Gaiellaceae bacterium]|nr:alpha/beta fold hydrolase [Gaiellaceae bacterium]